MSTPKETLILIFLITVTVSCEVSSADDSTDLCSNDLVDYNNYTALKVEGCGCELCVRKCCRSGLYYYHDGDTDDGQLISGCAKDESGNVSIAIHDIDKKVLGLYGEFSIGILNCTNQKATEFKQDNNDSRHYFCLQQNGTLYYPHGDALDNDTDYCVEDKDEITTYYFCHDPKSLALMIHFFAKIIPVPFLLATSLVYIFLREKNLHKNALIFHTICLIPANILLAVNQCVIIENDEICIGSGYIILYCLIASYFWMNVMCIDIWIAFSGPFGIIGRLRKENALYTILSVYAWGMPGAILIVVILLDNYGDEETSYYPGIGVESCFLKDVPSLIYNFGPTVALIVFNSVLFILTTLNIQKAKREATTLERADSGRHSGRDDVKFTLYWNLLFVMGINPIVNSHLIQFIAWMVGWLTSPKFALYFFYYKDFSHTMYGIVIFFIFVCNKRIWKDLKERYYRWTGKPRLNSSTTTTISSKSVIEDGVNGVRLTDFKVNKEESV